MTAIKRLKDWSYCHSMHLTLEANGIKTAGGSDDGE